MNTITAMDKNVTYIPTAEESGRVKTEITRLLNSLEPGSLEKAIGIEKMYGQDGIFWKQNGWFIKAMQNHPNYNGNYQIVFPACELKRRINEEAIENFKAYCVTNFWGHPGLKMIECVCHCAKEGKQYVDDEVIWNLNWFLGINPIVDIRKGEKITRLVGRIAKACGFDKHVDLRFNEVTNRHVDYGWVREYAFFADAISVQPINETVVISVNPYDFYTCSHGDRWSTCYETRKVGKPIKGSYGGENCNGVQALLFDNSTFIVYTVGGDGIRPELEPKKRMCFFYAGEDKLVQARVYPLAKEMPSATDLITQLRNITQKTIAEMFNIPNYWAVARGAHACESVIIRPQNSKDYPDYRHSDDVNVSYAILTDNYKNEKKIIVGSVPICPECGEVNDQDIYNNSLFCEDCRTRVCYGCGKFVNDAERDDDYDWYCPCCKAKGLGYWEDDGNWEDDDEEDDSDERYCYLSGDPWDA